MMEEARFEFADTGHHNLLIPITTVGKMAVNYGRNVACPRGGKRRWVRVKQAPALMHIPAFAMWRINSAQTGV